MGNGKSKFYALAAAFCGVLFVLELVGQQNRVAAGFTFEYPALTILAIVGVAFAVGAVTNRVRPMQQLPPPTPPGTNPARWAPDPTGEHRLRWWDGECWTDHTHD